MPAVAVARAHTSGRTGASRGFGAAAHAASSSTWVFRVHPDGEVQTCRLQFRVQLGQMSEPRTLPLVVEAVKDLTPHMRRIQLRGPSLEAFEYFPGQDLPRGIVPADASIVPRRYTIRRFDPGKRLVDLDVVMH